MDCVSAGNLHEDSGQDDEFLLEDDKIMEQDNQTDEEDEEEGSEEEDEEDQNSLSSNENRDGNTSPDRTMLEQFHLYCTTHNEWFLPLSKEEITSIRLMDILRQKKAPLNAHQEVLEWHLKDKGWIREHESLKDAPEYKTRSTLMKKLIPRYNLEAMMPKIKRVRLPSSKAVVKIPYRDAKDCIVSLLTDPRFDPKDYLFTNKNPFAPPPDQVQYLEDLNTGAAYLKTYKDLIKKPNQVLLMVVLYIDGATTGQFTNLPVTALKISLGFHTREARDKNKAWREMGWIPQVRKSKARGKKLVKESGHLESQDVFVVDGEGDTDSDREEQDQDAHAGDSSSEDEDTQVKAQDFHTMLATVLAPFVKLQESGFMFDLVHNRTLYKDAEIIPIVMCVKCDTEEGDLLCGKFLSRTKGVKHVCRYCHTSMDQADNPLAKIRLKTQAEIQNLVEKGQLDKLQQILQQYIRNAFYKVKFHRANAMGIHGTCPSDKLHAVLLGIFKYVRDIFFDFMGKSSLLADDINGLAKSYGKFFTRQSERRLPKTAFTQGIAQGRLMATHYRGVLLIIAAVLHSTLGRKLLMKKKKFGKMEGLKDWITLVELLLMWESYLCEKRMKVLDVKKLKTKHRYIMYLMKNVAVRTEGMGLKLMKFHATLHMVQDIILFGVPYEFDTGANESHHKPTKAAAKMTQRKEATFNIQTATRMTEFLALDFAMAEIEEDRCIWEYFCYDHVVKAEQKLLDMDDVDPDLESGMQDMSMETEGLELETASED